MKAQLDFWSRRYSPGTTKAHHGVLKAPPEALNIYHGALEARPGAEVAQRHIYAYFRATEPWSLGGTPRSITVEAHFGAMPFEAKDRAIIEPWKPILE